MEAFAKTLPGLPMPVLRLRYGFALETMVNTLARVNFPNHFDDSGPVEDLGLLLTELQRFIAAGFSAPYP